MKTICFIPKTTEQIEEIDRLGLKSEWLQKVGMKALAAYNQTTSHDATTAPGTYAYFAAIRALRDILCPKGWGRSVHKNVEMVVHPEDLISIIVSSGNQDTGNKKRNPKTKNIKGTQTKNLVSFNKEQLQFPFMKQKITNISINHTWMLLFHVDEQKSQMRIELSLPIEMDVDELRVSGWQKRIIIDPIDFSHTPDPSDLEKDFTQEFTVELRRKSNG